MKQNFGMGGPEAIGLAIVGATIGAVLCDAAISNVTLHIALGALIGGAMLPAVFLIRWSRLLRPRPHARLRERMPD